MKRTTRFCLRSETKILFRAMAESQELLTLIRKEDSYSGLYYDIVKLAGDIADSYFWLSDENAFDLKSSLTEIQGNRFKCDWRV